MVVESFCNLAISLGQSQVLGFVKLTFGALVLFVFTVYTDVNNTLLHKYNTQY